MGRLLLKIAAPVVGVGALFGAGFSAKKFGFIEVGTWAWLWPLLVAVVLLALAVFVLLKGARRWLWPLITGFVVQSVGVLFYVFESIDSPWETLLWTGISIVIVLLGMGIYYLVQYWRARKTEQGMLEAGLEDGVDPDELAKIRDNMTEAIALMRRAGAGRNAIYELPWFLVVGRPSAGKTVAIKKSGLGLPVKKDWVKGVGGTYSCDFFFTNELIFMDTPGRWVRDGADDKAKRYWESLLKLLRKYRGRRPLDGLVVVVSSEDLAGGDVDPDERVDLEDQAANIREIIDLMHENLNFRFPIYLLVSKVDLVTGFTDFFWGIPAQRRHEILGWSNPDPNDVRIEAMVHKGVDSVLGRLERYRLELLAKLGRKSRARRLYFFAEELKQIRDPLADFARVLFYEDPSRQSPIFRGFYFTSGMQGVGSPVSKAMASLAKNLNIPRRPSVAASEEEGERSFFLLELFRELMVGDEGLIGRTAKHWWKQRRNTAFGAFLPAGVATLILLLSGVSFLWNRSVYSDIRVRVPEINQQLQVDLEEHGGEELTYETLTRRLALTDELRGYHRKLTNLNPFRRFGMRRAAALSRETFEVYKEQFSEAVLRPTLKLAQEVATQSTCADRVDVFHSVVWMRLGRRFDTSDANMAGFDIVWSGIDLKPEESAELRSELLKQFRYLVVHDPTKNVGGLLRGFQMYPVAEALKRDCDMAGAGSALDKFRLFQVNCETAGTDAELQQCYGMLTEVAEWDARDTDRYLSHIRALQESLGELKAEESEAEEALALLDQMDLGKQEKSECVADFANLLGPLKNFAVRPDLLEQCRTEIAPLPSLREKRAKRTEIINGQVESLTAAGQLLEQGMSAYSLKCQGETLVPFNIFALDFRVVNDVSYNYRRQACIGFKATPKRARPAIIPAVAPARSTTPTRTERASTPAVRRERAYGPFIGYCTPGGGSRSEGWDRSKDDWIAEYASADDPQVTPVIREREKQAVKGKVRGFGSRLTSQWLSCLGKLRLMDPETSVPAWLTSLSTAPEYVELLGRPAEDAAEILATAGEEPLDAVVPTLKPLESLAGFAEGKAAEYQNLLGLLAEELKTIETDAAAFYAYRQAFEASDPSNSLVALKRWVGANATLVADGRLAALFGQPLNHVERFVSSDKLITAQWQELVQRFENDLASRFPFAADKSDPDLEMAELAAVTSVFGLSSGAVYKIQQTGELGPHARQWLDQAKQVSHALFKPDSDEPRALTLTTEALPPVSDDERVAKKFKVGQSILSVAPGIDLKWEEGSDEEAVERFKLDLLGEDASRRATLKVWVVERKGRFARGFLPAKKEWKKDAASILVSEAKGSWAPLVLLRDGLKSGAGAETVQLQFVAEWSWDKDKKQGTFNLPYSVTASHLPRLLTLLDEGFAAPPRSPTD